MTYQLNDKQYEAVRRLPPPLRYEHLVKRAAAYGELWALESKDGWVLGADEQGREFLPVWPHPQYAEASANGPWEGTLPVAIRVKDWLDSWTADLVGNARLVGVFPVDEQANAAIDPEAFAADLEDELDLY